MNYPSAKNNVLLLMKLFNKYGRNLIQNSSIWLYLKVMRIKITSRREILNENEDTVQTIDLSNKILKIAGPVLPQKPKIYKVYNIINIGADADLSNDSLINAELLQSGEFSNNNNDVFHDKNKKINQLLSKNDLLGDDSSEIYESRCCLTIQESKFAEMHDSSSQEAILPTVPFFNDKLINAEQETQTNAISFVNLSSKRSPNTHKRKSKRKRKPALTATAEVPFLDFKKSNEMQENRLKAGKKRKQKPPRRIRSEQTKDPFLFSEGNHTEQGRTQFLEVKAEEDSQAAHEVFIPNPNLNEEVPLFNFNENNIQQTPKSLLCFPINVDNNMQIKTRSKKQKSLRRRQETAENYLINSTDIKAEHLDLKAEENSSDIQDIFSTSANGQFVEKNARKRKCTKKIKKHLQQNDLIDKESNTTYIRNPFYSPIVQSNVPKMEPRGVLNYNPAAVPIIEPYDETTQQRSTLPHPRESYNFTNTYQPRVPVYRPPETMVDYNYAANSFNYDVYDFNETENNDNEDVKEKVTPPFNPSLLNPMDPFSYELLDYNSVKCDICLTRVHRDILVLHRLSHTEESTYRCLWCNKASFRYKKALANHIIRHYTNVITKGGYTRCKKDPYRLCDICNARVHKSSLNRHRESHENKKHVCAICQQQFTTVWNMRRHLRIHTGEKRFQCSVCQNYLSTKEKLNQHLLTHSGYKPFECDVCKQRYTTKYTLDIHKRNANHTTSQQPHSNNLQCNICHTVFTTLRNYAVHKFFNHPEECVNDAVKTNELLDVRPIVCEVCFVTCETVESFKSHLMGHMKRHLCLICKVECVTKQGLLNHMVEQHDDM